MKKIVIFTVLILLIFGALFSYNYKQIDNFLRKNQRKVLVESPSQCPKQDISFKQMYQDESNKDFKIELENDPQIIVTYEDQIVDSHWFIGSPEKYSTFIPQKYCVFRFKEPITLTYYYKEKPILTQKYTITTIAPFPKDDDLILDSYEIETGYLDFSDRHRLSNAKFKFEGKQTSIIPNRISDSTMDVHPGYSTLLIAGESKIY